MTEKEVIRYDSPEAATVKTVSGWVSRDGRFWANDEHMARWDGCTHVLCEDCKEPLEKLYVRCRACREKQDEAEYAKFPRRPWDGECMLYSRALDRYFSTPDELWDYVESEGVATVETFQVVLTSPNLLHTVDSDYWCDELPEDGELPDNVAAALDLLNEAIEQAGTVSWSPEDVAWNGETP